MTTTITFPAMTRGELAPAVQAHFGRPEDFRQGQLPVEPGSYVWTCGEDDAVVYIGSAASLKKRLGDYGRWMAGYDPDSEWTVTVVHMLKTLDARVQWLPTGTHAEALELERRLIEWHRACIGAAPPIVGWDAKPGSRRAEAEKWSRELYNATHPRAADPD